MKKYMVSLFYCLLLIITSCASDNYQQQSMTNNNSENKKLSWPGVYEGYFPDNSLLVEIQLNEDDTYDLVYFEKGKLKISVKNSGKISWSNDKKIIALFGYSKPIEFYVHENSIHLKTFGQKTFNENEIIFKQIKFY